MPGSAAGGKCLSLFNFNHTHSSRRLCFAHQTGSRIHKEPAVSELDLGADIFGELISSPSWKPVDFTRKVQEHISVWCLFQTAVLLQEVGVSSLTHFVGIPLHPADRSPKNSGEPMGSLCVPLCFLSMDLIWCEKWWIHGLGSWTMGWTIQRWQWCKGGQY